MVMPTLRVVAEAAPGRARGAAGDPGLGREVSAGYLQTYEADLTTVRGEDEGDFGESIEIGDAVFPPGVPLDSEFTVSSIALISASGVRTETGLEFSFLYGLEYTAMDLEVEGALQEGEIDEKELGFLFGARVRWLVTEYLRIYGSTRVSALTYSLSQDELGIELRIVPRVALFTGYRRTEYELDYSGDSEIELRAKGIVAGVQLEF
jgi:hypothetical protein